MTRKQRRAVLIGVGVARPVLAVRSCSSRCATLSSSSTRRAKSRKSTSPRVSVFASAACRRGASSAARQHGRIRRHRHAASTIPVRYKGILPDLFREGQGVVAEGKLLTRPVAFWPTPCSPSMTRTTCPPKLAEAR